MSRTSDITVTCDDGFPLAARVFRPAAANSEAIAVAPGSGIPQRFYYNFCTYLASAGYTVLTWDWRGVGDSAPDQLKDFDANMLDWAQLDQPAVLDWLYNDNGLPITGIGHSFGGQVFGLYPEPGRFRQLVLLASGNAYWPMWSAPARYVFRAAITVLPVVARLFGYLPGKLLGLGADLPRGVAEQWFGWCRNADYHGNWTGARQLDVPVLSYGFSDDNYAPESQRDWLLQRYGGDKTLITVKPADFDLQRIGHLDFFRQRHRDSLWPDLLQQLPLPPAGSRNDP